MIDKNFAGHFAREWINSWNSHDLNRILSHYDDNFEMPSEKDFSSESRPVIKTVKE